jgi:hypothetical protein
MTSFSCSKIISKQPFDHNNKGTKHCYASGNVGASGSGTESGKDENDRECIGRELENQKETRKGDLLQYTVIIILVDNEAAISTVTYVLVARSKKAVMMSQYNGAALKVIESLNIMTQKNGLLNTTGITATRYGHHHDTYC